jgi:membrane-bound lytic murein transglycosylase D
LASRISGWRIIKRRKMNKRLLLLSILAIGWLTATLADNHLRAKSRSVTAKHYANKNLTINNLKKDSVGDFKDLFVAGTMNSSNGAILNPKAIHFVQDYIEKNGKDLQSMKAWGRPYFNLIDGILTQYGLPRELKYMAVIESNLRPNSVSWKGAVGPWQLMPSTARILGLKVSHRFDERRNYYKSTKAAAKYLRDLYNELGDWLLVMAAYNGGTAHVYHAINCSHSHDFWKLQYYLPAESRDYVKKFIGTHYVFEGQGGVTTLTRAEATRQLSGSDMYVFSRQITVAELHASQVISVTGKYYSGAIAKYIVMDLGDFNRYNPEFDRVMASSNNTYDLRLPADKADLFAANKYQILNESVQTLLSQTTAEAGFSPANRDLAQVDDY